LATEHSDPPSSLIGRYYDEQAQREWERVERHRTEFAVTMRALADPLPLPPARVLARRGCAVTLFDLSAECLPHCDHDRLLALLRGEQAAGVL
jgi:hypothetical protein